MKTALITNLYFEKYTGSELHTLEVAKQLNKRGYKVTVAVFSKAYPLLDYIDQDIHVIEIQNEPLDQTEFDLVWIQHYPVYDYLAVHYDIKYKNMIVSILSSHLPIESLPSCYQEADIIACVSEECKDKLYQETKKDNLIVFPNSISFGSINPKDVNCDAPKNIAVVSNHICDEIKQLKQEYKDVDITYIGQESRPTLVTNELLQNFDLIITIGRTVQQAFACKVPVYVYDIFGGPGFIAQKNFELAAKNNFSGRGFTKKSTQEIIRDIKTNYASKQSNLDFLYDQTLQLFNQDTFFQHLLKMLEPTNTYKPLSTYTNLEKKRLEVYTDQIVHTIKHSISQEAKLYFDTGNGFNEQKTITWFGCAGYPIKQAINLPPHTKAIRFDPCSNFSKTSLESFKINGTEYKEQAILINEYTMDPQYHVQINNESQHESKLEISYTFHFIDMNPEITNLVNNVNALTQENKNYRALYEKTLHSKIRHIRHKLDQ